MGAASGRSMGLTVLLLLLFGKKIIAVVGGAHLAGLEDAALEHAVTALRAASTGVLPDLYLNHCTGERALAFLGRAFGEKVSPCPAGTVLGFDWN